MGNIVIPEKFDLQLELSLISNSPSESCIPVITFTFIASNVDTLYPERITCNNRDIDVYELIRIINSNIVFIAYLRTINVYSNVSDEEIYDMVYNNIVNNDNGMIQIDFIYSYTHWNSSYNFEVNNYILLIITEDYEEKDPKDLCVLQLIGYA